ncbi:hypothetical protein Ddc_22991 [Ditylenchus destructor]|nr:hypothetical protein Ddc_22991 [Ditylenchus destructor]
MLAAIPQQRAAVDAFIERPAHRSLLQRLIHTSPPTRRRIRADDQGRLPRDQPRPRSPRPHQPRRAHERRATRRIENGNHAEAAKLPASRAAMAAKAALLAGAGGSAGNSATVTFSAGSPSTLFKISALILGVNAPRSTSGRCLMKTEAAAGCACRLADASPAPPDAPAPRPRRRCWPPCWTAPATAHTAAAPAPPTASRAATLARASAAPPPESRRRRPAPHRSSPVQLLRLDAGLAQRGHDLVGLALGEVPVEDLLLAPDSKAAAASASIDTKKKDGSGAVGASSSPLLAEELLQPVRSAIGDVGRELAMEHELLAAQRQLHHVAGPHLGAGQAGGVGHAAQALGLGVDVVEGLEHLRRDLRDRRHARGVDARAVAGPALGAPQRLLEAAEVRQRQAVAGPRARPRRRVARDGRGRRDRRQAQDRDRAHCLRAIVSSADPTEASAVCEELLRKPISRDIAVSSVMSAGLSALALPICADLSVIWSALASRALPQASAIASNQLPVPPAAPVPCRCPAGCVESCSSVLLSVVEWWEGRPVGPMGAGRRPREGTGRLTCSSELDAGLLAVALQHQRLRQHRRDAMAAGQHRADEVARAVGGHQMRQLALADQRDDALARLVAGRGSLVLRCRHRCTGDQRRHRRVRGRGQRDQQRPHEASDAQHRAAARQPGVDAAARRMPGHAARAARSPPGPRPRDRRRVADLHRDQQGPAEDRARRMRVLAERHLAGEHFHARLAIALRAQAEQGGALAVDQQIGADASSMSSPARSTSAPPVAGHGTRAPACGPPRTRSSSASGDIDGVACIDGSTAEADADGPSTALAVATSPRSVRGRRSPASGWSRAPPPGSRRPAPRSCCRPRPAPAA